MFLNLLSCLLSAEVMRDSAILALKNNIVDKVNARLLDLMPGQETILLLIDYCKDIENVGNFSVEFLYIINLAALPPH